MNKEIDLSLSYSQTQGSLPCRQSKPHFFCSRNDRRLLSHSETPASDIIETVSTLGLFCFNKLKKNRSFKFLGK